MIAREEVGVYVSLFKSVRKHKGRGRNQSLGSKEAYGHSLSSCLSRGYGGQKQRRQEEPSAVIRVHKRFQLSLLQGAKDVLHSNVKGS